MGAWELYRAHWQQAGGSISIIEFEKDPPDSNYVLEQKLGELCGSSFWVFLSQRFQLMDPENERYAAEIEKSIYNVALANQDGGTGLRYHTMMEGKKEKSTHENTCCEGQGTRLLGSLPEHIYSIAPDGLYVHLYEPSTIRWQQSGEEMALTMETKFPLANDVRMTVRAAKPTHAKLRVRVPSWASGAMTITVNGKSHAKGKPGSYVTVAREWRNDDAIAFTLPAALRVTQYKGAEQVAGKARYSVEYGPILLAAVGASKVELAVAGKSAEDLAGSLEPVANAPLHFTVRGNAGVKLMPYWQIAEEEFTCYPVVTVKA